MHEDSRIRDRSLALCQAIRKHAELSESEPGESLELRTAAEDVAEAVSSYADVILEERHETVLFESHGEDSSNQQDSIDAWSDQFTSEENEFIIEDLYLIRILNPEKLVIFVQSKSGTHITNPEEALRVLCEEDGWNVLLYPEDVLSVNSHSIETV